MNPELAEVPPRCLSEDDRVSATENPAYTIWIQQDSTLFTWLLSSLSDSILPTVVNCTESWQIWHELRNFFQVQAQAQSTKLRTELKNVSKGTKSISEYLNQIKTIVNALISI